MDPDRIDRILQRANDLLDQGRPAAVLRCLKPIQDLLVDRDDRIECAALRAWALAELDRPEEALDLLEPLVQEFPNSVRLRTALGVALSGYGELEPACDELEAAVELDDQDETALANLALVHEKLRDYERALELYDRAIDLGGDIDWLLARKASVQTDLGRLAQARTSLHRYLSLVPDDAEQWIALAILYSDARDDERAYECYERAEQLEPKSPSLRLNWGVTAVRCGDRVQAERQLAELQKVEGESPRGLLLAAFLLEEKGDLDGAAEHYDKALRLTEAAPETPGRPPRFDDWEGFGPAGDRRYALEMAMDFFSRRRDRERCEALMAQAYAANACSVELCEAYRECAGPSVARATWFSIVIEAAYRPGLIEVRERRGPEEKMPDAADQKTPRARRRHVTPHAPNRFARNVQVIAADRDEALDIVLTLARRMKEHRLRVREFVAEESIENTHIGIYEIEHESFVFRERRST